MRVIICGAGRVGFGIASYLSGEENDVTVIDVRPDLIQRINDTLDVKGVIGYASDPAVLSGAGARDADVIIAVTYSDEVNMVACQVAHSLFNIPKKIARIRNQSYLDPAWSNLFSRAHMPIDVIISPEVEVAKDLYKRLHTPGTTNVVELADGQVHFAGVICDEACPLLHTQLKQIPLLFPDLAMHISGILRDNALITLNEKMQILPGDEVFFFVETSQLFRALAAFGHTEPPARKVIIAGGGNIGLDVASKLLTHSKEIRLKMIESDQNRAITLSEKLENRVIVLHGDCLNRSVLEEADIDAADALIMATNDDEANILGSLLGKQYGCARVLTLVNKVTYGPLMGTLGIDAVVSPRAITVSRIMKHVRRGRIKASHSLRDDFAEVMEVEVSEAVDIVGVSLEDLDLPRQIRVGMIVRDDKIILPSGTTALQPGDHVMIFVMRGYAKEVEKLFSVHIDLF